MKRQRLVLVWLALVLVGGNAGCESGSVANTSLVIDDARSAVTPTEPVLTPGADWTVVNAEETPIPYPQTTPSPALLRIWWPDELYPPDGSTAQTIFTEQLNGFRQAYPNYELDLRRKRANGLGGILPTLRTAVPVAPGTLPDLTLMQRADMITAAGEGLIVPLENWVPAEILNDLLPGTRALGEIDGQLYGLPYALNLIHVAYRASVFDGPLLTFDDVLRQSPDYRFPAGVEQGSAVNWTVLLQYLAAGGRLVDENNVPVLDREPLLAVLEYYEAAVEQGLFDGSLLTSTSFSANWNSFMAGEAAMIGVDSLTYLSHKNSTSNLRLAPIPTPDGAPIAALDGWMWVLTTHDPDRQARARAFLSWMMRANSLALYSETLGVVPALDRALSLWDDEEYASFARTLIASAQIIPNTQRNNEAASALQEAVAAVLNGMSARDAADQALARLE